MYISLIPHESIFSVFKLESSQITNDIMFGLNFPHAVANIVGKSADTALVFD